MEQDPFHGQERYGIYMIPEEHCLRTSSVDRADVVIGQRLFLDGVERTIYRDGQGQYVIGNEDERVYGTWLVTDDVWDELPLIVDGTNTRKEA